MADSTPKEVLEETAAFRGQLEDMNDDTVDAICNQAKSANELKHNLRAWGDLRNFADREFDRAKILISTANAGKIHHAKAKMNSANAALNAGKQRLEDIAIALKTVHEAVSLFSSAIQFLA